VVRSVLILNLALLPTVLILTWVLRPRLKSTISVVKIFVFMVISYFVSIHSLSVAEILQSGLKSPNGTHRVGVQLIEFGVLSANIKILPP